MRTSSIHSPIQRIRTFLFFCLSFSLVLWNVAPSLRVSAYHSKNQENQAITCSTSDSEGKFTNENEVLLDGLTPFESLTSSTIPNLAPAKTVLFDNTKAETAGNADWIVDDDQPVPSPTNPTVETDWTGACSSWGVELAKAGYTIRTLPPTGRITFGDPTNAQDLSNYRVFVVPEPNSAFNSTEKAALLAFVENGGGLFMISDHINSDRNNDGTDSPRVWNDLFDNNPRGITNIFGIHYDLNNLVEDVTNAANTTHPVLTGPFGNARKTILRNGASLTLDTVKNPTALGLLYRNSVSNTGTTGVVLAAGKFGNGRLVAIGDSSPMEDITGTPGNSLHDGWHDPLNDSQFFTNGVAWLAGETGGTIPTPDFSLSVSPSSQTVTSGNSVSFTVSTTAAGGFSGNVNLNVTGTSSGVSATFGNAIITVGSSTTLTVSTASTTPSGTINLTVTGIGNGLSHSATASLVVTNSGGGGGGGTQTITASSNVPFAIPDNNTTGITSTINFSALNIQSVSVGVNITHTYRGDLQIDLISPNGTSTRLKSVSSSDGTANLVTTYAPTAFNGLNSSGNWKLVVKDLAAQDVGTLNSWSLTITGTTGSGGGPTGDFSLSLSQNTGTWTRGSSYGRTVYVTRSGGFTGPVSLTYSASKTGVFSTVTTDQNPVTGASTRMNFTLSSSAPTGTTVVTINGTDSSGRIRSTTLTLTIQ